MVCILWGKHISWKHHQEMCGFTAYEEVMELKEKMEAKEFNRERVSTYS